MPPTAVLKRWIKGPSGLLWFQIGGALYFITAAPHCGESLKNQSVGVMSREKKLQLLFCKSRMAEASGALDSFKKSKLKSVKVTAFLCVSKNQSYWISVFALSLPASFFSCGLWVDLPLAWVCKTKKKNK
jgi:hypothetical protein